MTHVLDTTRIQEVAYQDFLRAFRYRQDQHVTICGPTGCGKSVLITEVMMPRQPYLAFFSTKPRDATVEDFLEVEGRDGSALQLRMEDFLDGSQKKRFGQTDNPRDIHPHVHKKWIVGLKSFGDPDDVKERHRALFGSTLRHLFPRPGWALDIDEGRYICDPQYLGLKSLVAQYYIQGRSDSKSIVLATQRPVWVPLEAFDQATHLFFFNDEDLDNVIRMAQATGANRKRFEEVIPHLEISEDAGGQFLYYNRVTKQSLVSKVEM